MSARFTFHDTPIVGVVEIERVRVGDERGYFERQFCAQELAGAGWREPIAQINHSYTQHRGTVRGLHYQHPPAAEMKLVSCVRGAIYDVAVDIRAGSPTFLQHVGVELSAENAKSLLVPHGFAHGFMALSDDVEIIYYISAAYEPELESGLHPQDPALAIAWPQAITVLSDRDQSHAPVDANFKGIVL